MSIDIGQILDVLNDPTLGKFSFDVSGIPVNAREFRTVADYFDTYSIKLADGDTDDADAAYDPGANSLIVKSADALDPALILHECVHAIVDVKKLVVPRLHEEVAGYLTQITYSQVVRPTPLNPQVLPRDVTPMQRLIWTFKKAVIDCKLAEPQGFGVVISKELVDRLVEVVRADARYSSLKLDDATAAKNRGVQYLCYVARRYSNNTLRPIRIGPRL
jgi:hypothetical protein